MHMAATLHRPYIANLPGTHTASCTAACDTYQSAPNPGRRLWSQPHNAGLGFESVTSDSFPNYRRRWRGAATPSATGPMHYIDY